MAAEPEVHADEVVRLPGRARAGLTALLLVLVTLFLAGTAVGEDSWWPFGPWRMFANSTAPSGSIYSLRIEVQRADDPTWQLAPLNPSSVGLNRAEVEGRIPQMTANPKILGTLAHSHSRLRPDEPDWTAVRVVRSEVLLNDGTPTGKVKETPLVEWVAP